MRQPPEFLMPILHSIEGTALHVYEEFPALKDKQIEAVYIKLHDYYKKAMQNTNTEEPLFPSDRMQALSDEILNVLELREEQKMDIDYVNDPDSTIGGIVLQSLPHMYTICFKHLERSARFWRKQNGERGYLKHIGDHVL